MFVGNALKAGLVLALAITASNTAQGATFATFDVAQFQNNGFRFGDFDDNFFGNFDVSGGVFSLDLTEDIDLANGFFGGTGSDVAADFATETTDIEVRFAVGADNAAADFRIVLVDNDGVGVGEEYQYAVDLTGVAPEDGFVTQTLPLDSFIFRQAAFNQTDGDMELNYGLSQIQIQSAFGVTDRLQVDIESVKLIDPEAPENPLLVELTPVTFASQPQSFDFGTFQDAGVVDQTSGNFVIDTTQSPSDGESGGLGFNGLNFDLNPYEYAIEVEAKLLSGNTAETFNLLIGDEDGDDSGPEMGSEDYIFTVPTSEFDDTEFTTFKIPLGSGSESAAVQTFGFTNGGDGEQNFGLSQLQIQADSDAEGGIGTGLAIEIVRFSIVNLQAIDGDFNADGVVDAADYTVYRDNLNGSEDILRGAGDGSGTVDAGDLALWQDNYGAIADAAGSAVPEPTTAALLALTAAAVGVSRRRG